MRVREPKRAWLLPGQAFIAFLGTLHWRWSSFTMHKFAVGDYLYRQQRKECCWLLQREGCYKSRGKVVEPVILGRFSSDFRKLLQRYAVNTCCLNSGLGSFSKSKSHSSLGTMQAWFPTGEPIRGRGSCVLDLAFHWPFSRSWAHGMQNGLLYCIICSIPQTPIGSYYVQTAMDDIKMNKTDP